MTRNQRTSKPTTKPIINLSVERARRRPKTLRDRVRGGWKSTQDEWPRRIDTERDSAS
jgi:hypothetical protein